MMVDRFGRHCHDGTFVKWNEKRRGTRRRQFVLTQRLERGA
jgi:hypothetical protein